LELYEHSTTARSTVLLPTPRRHGEPNGTKPVPERQAEHAPLREITITITRTITCTVACAIARTQWTQPAAETEA
jgi:hypothetical protein